jgi:hypothetical protein
MLAGIEDPGLTCHMNSTLCLLAAIGIFAPSTFPDELPGDELAISWTELITDLRDCEVQDAVDPRHLYGLLDVLPSFASDDGHWIEMMRNPMESFGRLLNCEVGSYLYRGQTLASLFAIHVVRQATCICPGALRQADVVTDDWVSSVTIRPGSVPAGEFTDGSWLLSGFPVRSNFGPYPHCDQAHDWDLAFGFLEVPRLLAIDFTSSYLEKGRHRPVRAPLQLMAQVQGGSTSAVYEMFGFVQLKDHHCKAFVRASADCFDVYNDGLREFFGVNPRAVQIRDWVSLAIYRLIDEA